MPDDSKDRSVNEKEQIGDEDTNQPEWWQQNRREFREHDLPPYHPPQFADGIPTPERIQTLEAELGVDIKVRSIDPQGRGNWELLIDGDVVATIDRFRSRAGYTQYELTSDRFESLVRNAVD